MNKLREEFEELPEIRKIMNENGIHFMNHSGWYEARDFKDFEYEQYINGAWYAFQEQQKKIDEIVSIVRDADLSDGDSSVAIVHDEIQELLK